MPVFITSAQFDHHKLDTVSVKSTWSTLDSPIMTPSSPCDDIASVAQPILTSEIISNLMNRIEDVSRREGILSEREKSLGFHVKALTKREEALDKREQELDFEKLPAVDKLKVAVEQLKASDEPVVSNLFRDYYKKVSARTAELEAKLEEQVKVNAILLLQAEEQRARENNVEGATTAKLATIPAPSPIVSSSSGEKPNDASKQCERQDEQIEKEEDEVVEAISDNPVSTGAGPDDRKPKELINPPPTSTFDFSSASRNPDLYYSPHTARNGLLSQPLFSTSTQPKRSALITVNLSPVSTGKSSQIAPPSSSITSDVSEDGLRMPVRQPKNVSAFSTKCSAKVKRERSWSKRFGKVSASSSAYAKVPPPPARKWPAPIEAPETDAEVFEEGLVARDTTLSPVDGFDSGGEYGPGHWEFGRRPQKKQNRFEHNFEEQPQPYDHAHGWETPNKRVERKHSGTTDWW
jgi:hypothetical protein